VELQPHCTGRKTEAPKGEVLCLETPSCHSNLGLSNTRGWALHYCASVWLLLAYPTGQGDCTSQGSPANPISRQLLLGKSFQGHTDGLYFLFHMAVLSVSEDGSSLPGSLPLPTCNPAPSKLLFRHFLLPKQWGGVSHLPQRQFSSDGLSAQDRTQLRPLSVLRIHQGPLLCVLFC
jgi:hypothetical protein